MAITRNERIGIDDRWTRRVKGPDGKMTTVDSPLKGKVTRWRLRWVDEGKEHSKSFERKTDAEAYKKKLTAEIHTGEYVDPRKSAEPFRDVAEQWFKTKQHRQPKTIAGYRSLLDTIVLPQWGDVPLRKIDYESYSTWLGTLSVDGSQRGEPLSASRITQAHQLVGAVLKYAQKTGRVAKNVAIDEIERDKDLPESTERERRYLTHEELLRLSHAIGSYGTLTLVLGYCGLRFGEAAALRRRHVDNRKRELTISMSATSVHGQGIVESSTKTKRTRHVRVPMPVWERLKDELPDDPNALVFPSQVNGGHMGIGEYRWRFDKACKAVGIEGLVPHGLRHTCASLAISAGANVKVVQRMLGHATAAMTLDLYGHLLSDDLAAVDTALGNAIETAAVSLRYDSQEGSEAGSLETA